MTITTAANPPYIEKVSTPGISYVISGDGSDNFKAATSSWSLLGMDPVEYRPISIFVPTAIGKHESYMQALRQSVLESWTALFEEDEEFIPTPTAMTTAYGLVISVLNNMTPDMPNPKIVPDGQGGIHVYFNRPNRRVHLIVPSSPTNPPFIYVSSTSGANTFSNATRDMLCEHLRWLAEG